MYLQTPDQTQVVTQEAGLVVPTAARPERGHRATVAKAATTGQLGARVADLPAAGQVVVLAARVERGPRMQCSTGHIRIIWSESDSTICPMCKLPGLARQLPPQIRPEDIVVLWNERAPAGLPRVKVLPPSRRYKVVKAVQSQPSPKFWIGVLAEYRASAFLQGQKNGNGHEGFKADFDWLFSRGQDGTENWAKVAEGKYRDPRFRGASHG